jgi:hypothetical protein
MNGTAKHQVISASWQSWFKGLGLILSLLFIYSCARVPASYTQAPPRQHRKQVSTPVETIQTECGYRWTGTTVLTSLDCEKLKVIGPIMSGIIIKYDTDGMWATNGIPEGAIIYSIENMTYTGDIEAQKRRLDENIWRLTTARGMHVGVLIQGACYEKYVRCP